jgi:hypothetical protein
VQYYCEVLGQALDSAENDEVVIDMDVVADAVSKEGEKPSFYVSEESQQCKFICAACEEFNDILGRFGYCSLCGTRNDLADFECSTVPNIREHLKAGIAPEDCVRDAVASFDSYMGQIAKELARRVPLTTARKTRLLRHRFHCVEEMQIIFKNWFDIDICEGMKDEERRFVVKMFHRRHVYEHNGGEVDQKYIDDSGDTSVRLKQHIHETQKDAHDLLSALVKMATNIHQGIHELFPPHQEPIKMH